jgi:hypothetical protein
MYLYGATSNSAVDGRPKKPPKNFIHKVVSSELNNQAILRNELKDTTSSKLQLKGPRMAEALHVAEMSVLRKQLDAFNEDLLENTRTSYMLEQNNKRRNLQEFQCNFLTKLEALVKQQLNEKGLDFRKYRIGGYDDGAYGKFASFCPMERLECDFFLFYK